MVSRACAAWPDLHAELTRLLMAHAAAGLFLERPADMGFFPSTRRL
jgi:hypothetical protein